MSHLNGFIISKLLLINKMNGKLKSKNKEGNREYADAFFFTIVMNAKLSRS